VRNDQLTLIVQAKLAMEKEDASLNQVLAFFCSFVSEFVRE